MGQMAASVASVLTSARSGRSASPATRGQAAPPAPAQKPEPPSALQPPLESPPDGKPAITATTSFLLPVAANGARPAPKRTEEKPASKVLRSWKPWHEQGGPGCDLIQAAIRGYWVSDFPPWLAILN